VVSGGWDNIVRIWNVSDCSVRSVWTDHTQAITKCTFSQDGRHVASSSYDGTIKLWNAETGKLEKNYSEHSGRVHDVVFSEDFLVSASNDHFVKIWNTNNTTTISEFYCSAPATTCTTSRVGDDMVMVCADLTGNLYHGKNGP